jgi:D-glycero-D-manno-heptose 1,7-bisphosphate phosphatase
MLKKSLFLDRDGVINIDRNYASKPSEIEFVEGIFDLGRYAIRKDYFIFVITNQSGIGREYYTEREFFLLTKWMKQVFEKEKCPITKVFYCPYHPVYGIGKYKRDSEFRKPNPGMILKAKRRYNLDLQNSVLIGDKKIDIETGLKAGVKVNLLFSLDKNEKLTRNGVYLIKTLSDAFPFII